MTPLEGAAPAAPGRSPAPPELSVVVPLHDEAGNVRALHSGICAALAPLRRPFEVLLVDDGSADGTGAIVDELADRDARVVPVHLDGNYGEAAALSAGFHLARGPVILTLDGDLQNDPADLPRLLLCLEAGGYRVVSGWRRARVEAVWRALPSRLANRLIAVVTGLPVRDTGCGLKAYRREVVREVSLPPGFHRYIPAVFGVRAGEFAEVEVLERPRRAGCSHYGLRRVLAVLRDLPAVPLVRADGRRGVARLRDGEAVAVAALASGLLAGGRRGRRVAGVALAALAAALAVEWNLERWRRAQRLRPYRIRAAGGTGREPAGRVAGS